MSDEGRDRDRDRDRVWLHGEKVGAGFKCKYCRETKSEGGGTRLKEHLAHRGKNVKKCPSVPPDIKAYYQLDIDKTNEKKSSRFRQQMRADEASRTHFGDDEYEDELQAALHQPHVEHKFSQRAGARYDRGGGSSSQRASRGPLDRMMGSREQVPERLETTILFKPLDQGNLIG
jgi:hypothetical protein